MDEPGNLNGLLSQIYREYIAIRDEDFHVHYKVLQHIVLDQLYGAMKQVDRYYARYRGGTMMAGSHFDKLRVEMPDEFDIYFPVNLPINIDINPADPNNSDINFKMGKRGSDYCELQMGTQFQNLPRRDDWETTKTAYKWMDKKKFLSRAKFYSWFQKVVDKALNEFRANRKYDPTFYVDGIAYMVRRKENGPAVTLIIENINEEFCLHVDLVPSLRFSKSRWPISKGYKKIPQECETGYFSLVPKPNKQWIDGIRWSSRSWRASLHTQEHVYIRDLYNLRQTVRLIKKLRNTLDMHEIKSYFIKTLFLKKVSTTRPTFWRKSPGALFKIMVEELYQAVCKRKIRYFWNNKCNFLDHAPKEELNRYARDLEELLEVLDDPTRYMEVAGFILSDHQFDDYFEEYEDED